MSPSLSETAGSSGVWSDGGARGVRAASSAVGIAGTQNASRNRLGYLREAAPGSAGPQDGLLPVLLGDLAQPRRDPAEDPDRQGRMVEEHALELPRRERQAAGGDL